MTVSYLIAILFLVLANGEQYENIKQDLSSQTFDQRLSGKKEYLLYLTPEQVQALQTEGAVVRPVSHQANAFLRQQYQQSVEENIKPQDQTVRSNEEPKQDKGLEDIYKMLNNLQVNDGIIVQTQSTEKLTEKSRGKHKYKSKLRQKENAYESYEYEKNVQHLPKNKNKANIRSTVYTPYAPRYGMETLIVNPGGHQTLPYYDFQNTEESSYLPIRGETNSSHIEIPKLENIPNPTKFQNPEEIQRHVAIQRREELQRYAERQTYDKVPEPVDVEDTGFPLHLRFGSEENNSSPTEVPKYEGVSKPSGFKRPKDIPEPVIIQRHEDTQRATQRQGFEKFQTPVEYEDLEPSLYLPSGSENHSKPKAIPKFQDVSKPTTGVQSPEMIQKPVVIPRHENIQRSERQRYEKFQTSVEYEDLEPSLYLSTGEENNSNPTAISKFEEVSKATRFQSPDEIQKPVVAQRHGDSQRSVQRQRYETFQTPAQYKGLQPPLYLPSGVENNSNSKAIPKFEGGSKTARFQSPEEIQKPVEIQRHGDIQNSAQRQSYEKFQTPVEYEDLEYLPSGPENNANLKAISQFEEASKPAEIQNPEDIQEPVVIQRHEDIQRAAQRERYEKLRKPVESQGRKEIKKPIEIQQQEYYRGPLEIQRQLQRNNDIKKPEIIDPIVQAPTYTIAIGRMLNGQPLSVVQSSTDNTRFVTFNETASDIINKKESFLENVETQNIVAEGLALQNFAKKRQGLIKEELTFKSLRRENKMRAPKPALSITPRSYPVSWVTPTSISVTVPQPEKGLLRQDEPIKVGKTIHIPGIKNSYSKLNTPYLMQKTVPGYINQKIPHTYPLDLDQPENYVILRPIWEH